MLPTREEAKEGLKVLEDWFNAISVPKLTKVLGKEYNRRNVLSDVIEVYKLYISGSLIEARTEGGIKSVLYALWDAAYYSKNLECRELNVNNLAHALVGKV
jgi:hypothetical protein